MSKLELWFVISNRSINQFLESCPGVEQVEIKILGCHYLSAKKDRDACSWVNEALRSQKTAPWN